VSAEPAIGDDDGSGFGDTAAPGFGDGVGGGLRPSQLHCLGRIRRLVRDLLVRAVVVLHYIAGIGAALVGKRADRRIAPHRRVDVRLHLDVVAPRLDHDDDATQPISRRSGAGFGRSHLAAF